MSTLCLLFHFFNQTNPLQDTQLEKLSKKLTKVKEKHEADIGEVNAQKEVAGEKLREEVATRDTQLQEQGAMVEERKVQVQELQAQLEEVKVRCLVLLFSCYRYMYIINHDKLFTL